jgi:hypothetical protein
VPAPGSPAPGFPGATSDEEDVPVPQWRSLLQAMAPKEDAAPARSTADAADTDTHLPVPAAEPAPEVPERIRRPLPFTWLQWVILVVVAFVLGFLIYSVASAATDGAGPDVPALALAVQDASPAP